MTEFLGDGARNYGEQDLFEAQSRQGPSASLFSFYLFIFFMAVFDSRSLLPCLCVCVPVATFTAAYRPGSKV